MTQQETTESCIWLTQYLIVFEFSEPEIQEKFKCSCFTVTNKSWKCFEFVLILEITALCCSCINIFLVTADLNSKIHEMAISDFRETFNFKNLVKDLTCYKSPSQPACIYSILTNFAKLLQHTQTIENDLPDFHKLTLFENAHS